MSTPTTTARGAAQRAMSPVAQPIVRATLALAGVAIVGAMVLSYSAQAALAQRCGLGSLLAWLFPVVVDVPLVASTLAATAMHAYPWRARAMPMATLLGYVAVSVWLNAMHAATLGAEIPTWLRVVILSIPAVTLAVVVELALVVSRRSEPRPARRAAQQVVQAVPAAVVERGVAVAQPSQPREQARNVDVQSRDDAPRSRRVYTDQQRQDALRLASEGLSQRQIAEAVDASKSAVQSWLAQTGVGAAA